MHWLRYFILSFFPLFIFSSPLSSRYAESFARSFQEGDFTKGLQTLDEWELFEPEQKSKITGLRAAIDFSMGDFEKGALLMDQFILGLSVEELSDPMMNFVLQMYYKALPNASGQHTNSVGMARPCKHEQPKGVKLRYWFGVGQILVGVIAAPFSGGASATLILSGLATVVDAAADALDNQSNWEKELDERQRMNPDIQQNSFFHESSNSDLRVQVV